MTHRLSTNYAKNYCNRTLIVKVIVENVVTCFFGTRCSSYFHSMTVYIIVPLCVVSDVIIKRIWGHVLSCISMYLRHDLQTGTKIGAEILVHLVYDN